MFRKKKSTLANCAYVVDALESRVMLSNSNSVPVFTSGSLIIFQAGVFDSFTVRVTGTPTPVITEQHLRLPAGITFADNHDGTATFSGTPSAADAGAYFPTIIANNGVGGDVNQFVRSMSTSLRSSRAAMGRHSRWAITIRSRLPRRAPSEGGFRGDGGAAIGSDISE